MAKTTNQLEVQGKLGAYVGYRRAGKFCLRRNNEKPTNRRWVTSMNQRIRMANIAHVWQALGINGEMYLFENKRPGQTDFNMFMGHNLAKGQAYAYLTKQEAALGVCVIAGYLVSQGTLPGINLTPLSGGKVETSIALGSELEVNANTKISDFSKAVIENNEDFVAGDRIVCFYAEQLVFVQQGSMDNIPYVKVRKCNVQLDVTNETKLFQVVDSDIFNASTNKKLGTNISLNGGICYIHVRPGETPSDVKVSTQHFVVNNTLMSTYASLTKKKEAVLSYGAPRVDFLRDGTTGVIVVTPDDNPGIEP